MSEIVKVAEEAKEFIQLEDGFWYYWPQKFGAIPAYQLRELADELDRRNKEWEQGIDEYFRNQQQSETSG